MHAAGRQHHESCIRDEIRFRVRAAIIDLQLSAEFWSGPMSKLYMDYS